MRQTSGVSGNIDVDQTEATKNIPEGVKQPGQPYLWVWMRAGGRRWWWWWRCKSLCEEKVERLCGGGCRSPSAWQEWRWEWQGRSFKPCFQLHHRGVGCICFCVTNQLVLVHCWFLFWSVPFGETVSGVRYEQKVNECWSCQREIKLRNTVVLFLLSWSN